MLTSPDGTTHGRFKQYLHEPNKWRRYDKDLFDALLPCQQGPGSLGIAHASCLLPGAQFFDEPVAPQRIGRERQFARVLESFAGLDLVFADPDNGFEVKSGRMLQKYILWDEVRRLFNAGHSVLVFQYYPRQKRPDYETTISERLRNETSAALVFGFTTPRVLFLLASRPEHVVRFQGHLETVNERWHEQIRAWSR